MEKWTNKKTRKLEVLELKVENPNENGKIGKLYNQANQIFSITALKVRTGAIGEIWLYI